MTMLETERGSRFVNEDSSSSPEEDYEEEDYETTSEELCESPADLIFQQEPFVHFRSLNNYLNNLNLATFNLHLNNRFNAFVQESSLYKLYENSPPFLPAGVRDNLPPLPKPPKIDVIVSNLWKQLGDHHNNDESDEVVEKRLEFEQVRKRANQEAQRRLGPKIHQKQKQQLQQKQQQQEFGGGGGEESTISRTISNSTTTSIIEGEGDVEGEEQTTRKSGGGGLIRHYQKKNLVDGTNIFRDREEDIINITTPSSSETEIEVEEEDPALNLNQEFWNQFLGFKTDGESESEGGSLGVVGEEPGTSRRPAAAPSPPINPFYNRFYLSYYDTVKLCLMFVVCLVRVAFVLVFLTMALLLMLLGTCGLTDKQFKEAPLSSWRRAMRWVAAHIVMRTVYFIAGFHWVNRIGKMASAKEAPVIVAAPHSSFFDAFIVPLLGGPSVVARLESSKTLFFGKLMDFTQAIYVDRDDPDSRNVCKREIHNRVQSDKGWPQVFIFPEGTCTNRSALAEFKLGAFKPGVPVQPVIVRYPNRLDCLTWTFDGPSAIWSVFVSLTQFHNSVELEFLPVYTPNEEEQGNDILFASNVQKVMADALGIPATDFNFNDGIALGNLAHKTKVRQKLSQIWKIKGELNLREAATETTVVYEGTTTNENFDWKITYPQFQQMFNVTEGGTQQASSSSLAGVKGLFKLFQDEQQEGGDQEEEEMIDMRPYLILTLLLNSDAKLSLLQALIFKMYAGSRREMTKSEFHNLMKSLFEAKEKDAEKLFNAELNSGSNHKNINIKTSISFSEFQQKIGRRVEFLKLYAMEETGQVSGNFPRRSQRDRRPTTTTATTQDKKPKLE